MTVERNAFSPDYWTTGAAAPLRLGFVPVGHLTVTELTDMVEVVGMEKQASTLPPGGKIDREDLLDIYRDAQRKVARALAAGRLEAIVHDITTQQNFRIPFTCWRPITFEIEAENFLMGKFTRLQDTNAIDGDEFGAYQGMTPCVLRTEGERFRDECKGGGGEGSTDQLPNLGRASAGELNVSINDRSVAKYAKDPETVRVAATRIQRDGGDPADETALRMMIWQMLKDQGHHCTFAAVKNARNNAGNNARK